MQHSNIMFFISLKSETLPGSGLNIRKVERKKRRLLKTLKAIKWHFSIKIQAY